jgi:hypothetical protein
MEKSGNDKRFFRHVGIGVPSIEGLKATIKALTESGATLVRKNDEGTKFFLKLNEGDITELELYLSDDTITGIHFDKSFKDLKDEPFAVKSTKSGALERSTAAGMFFAPIVAYQRQKTEIEMAFYYERFDWTSLIPKIEKTAADNDVMEIDVPEEEWERLEKEGWASLKERLSKNAADRLFPYKDKDRGRFELTVFRHCGYCQNAR